MAATPIAALSYPALTDTPNGPSQIQSLATSADSQLVPRYATTAARDAAITAPVAGQVCWTTTPATHWKYDGTNWVYVAPLGVIGYTQATANVGPTSAATTLDVLTASAVTIGAANRRIKITWHCRAISSTTAGADVYTVRIQEGATVLNESNYAPAVTAAVATGGCDFAAYVNGPSAGAHTYKVTIQRALGGGVATVTASATAPMYIVIEDVSAYP